MRLDAQLGTGKGEPEGGRAGLGVWWLCVLVAAGSSGCVGGGESTGAKPPTPVAAVRVAAAPEQSSVLLGNSTKFTATVTNAKDTDVTWSVNGIAGGNAGLGRIDGNGNYTAPGIMLTGETGPAGSTVEVSATSQADPSKMASATATILSDVSVTLSPSAATVELGVTEDFSATIASQGHPDTGIRWRLEGSACPGSCGAVDANGDFTAPQVLPAAAMVTVVAQSVADSGKQATAQVRITSSFSVQISAPASVGAGSAATISATMMAVAGSHPATGLTWSVSGVGCSGAACGVLSVVTTQSANVGAIENFATYTAPLVVPAPNAVTITVTPQADPSKKAQTTVSVQANGNASMTPASATVAANHRVTLTANLGSAPGSNGGVNWSVNGIPGGNSTFGQICVLQSNPCQPVTNGAAAQVDYLAPGATPSPNPVTVQATSAAGSMNTASAQITVINHVVVSVQPGSVTLAPLGVQAFSASVLGTSNQNVVWQVQGSACTSAGICGSIDPNGTYTAPAGAPSPNSVQVVAISEDDVSRSGAANVVISTGVNVQRIRPASVYAGAAGGFPMRINGSGFLPGGTGSVVWIAGTARTTACASSTECAAAINAADVALAGSVDVHIENAGGARSNTVLLVVATPNVRDEVITLSAGSPAATGKDIVVVEPTTAGISTADNDVDLKVAALGVFSTANNSCALGGGPIALQRPASGTATTDICIFSGSGLDTAMRYTVSGPGDVRVLSQQPAGLGVIRLTLEIAASAARGARTLFLINSNLDSAAATGALEVN